MQQLKQQSICTTPLIFIFFFTQIGRVHGDYDIQEINWEKKQIHTILAS